MSNPSNSSLIKTLFSIKSSRKSDSIMRLDGIKDLKDRMYISDLRWLANNRSKTIFNNDNSMNAAYVMANIFREIKESKKPEKVIRIYGNNLNGEISKYPVYEDEILPLLHDVNVKFKVLIDEIPKVNKAIGDNAFKLFYRYFHFGDFKNVEFKKVVNKEKTQKIIFDYFKRSDIHFAVSTESMYRIEMNPLLHFAECCFNDPNRSANLANVFDQIFKEGSNVELNQ